MLSTITILIFEGINSGRCSNGISVSSIYVHHGANNKAKKGVNSYGNNLQNTYRIK